LVFAAVLLNFALCAFSGWLGYWAGRGLPSIVNVDPKVNCQVMGPRVNVSEPQITVEPTHVEVRPRLTIPSPVVAVVPVVVERPTVRVISTDPKQFDQPEAPKVEQKKAEAVDPYEASEGKLLPPPKWVEKRE
jgi:hypothetical protein